MVGNVYMVDNKYLMMMTFRPTKSDLSLRNYIFCILLGKKYLEQGELLIPSGVVGEKEYCVLAGLQGIAAHIPRNIFKKIGHVPKKYIPIIYAAQWNTKITEEGLSIPRKEILDYLCKLRERMTLNGR